MEKRSQVMEGRTRPMLDATKILILLVSLVQYSSALPTYNARENQDEDTAKLHEYLARNLPYERDSVITSVTEKLKRFGVHKLEELKYVTTADLQDVLHIIQIRELLNAIEKDFIANNEREERPSNIKPILSAEQTRKQTLEKTNNEIPANYSAIAEHDEIVNLRMDPNKKYVELNKDDPVQQTEHDVSSTTGSNATKDNTQKERKNELQQSISTNKAESNKYVIPQDTHSIDYIAPSNYSKSLTSIEKSQNTEGEETSRQGVVHTNDNLQFEKDSPPDSLDKPETNNPLNLASSSKYFIKNSNGTDKPDKHQYMVRNGINHSENQSQTYDVNKNKEEDRDEFGHSLDKDTEEVHRELTSENNVGIEENQNKDSSNDDNKNAIQRQSATVSRIDLNEISNSQNTSDTSRQSGAASRIDLNDLNSQKTSDTSQQSGKVSRTDEISNSQKTSDTSQQSGKVSKIDLNELSSSQKTSDTSKVEYSDEDETDSPFANDIRDLGPVFSEDVNQLSQQQTSQEEPILRLFRRPNFNKIPNIRQASANERDSNLEVHRKFHDKGTLGSMNFMTYFVIVSVLVAIGYVGMHNKQRIVAVILEGRRGRGKRQKPSNEAAQPLVADMTEVVSTTEKPPSVKNFIY